MVLQLVFRKSFKFGNNEDLYKYSMIFFMESLVDKCDHILICETIYLMTAKIGRRLLKLYLADESAWFDTIQDILGRMSKRV